MSSTGGPGGREACDENRRSASVTDGIGKTGSGQVDAIILAGGRGTRLRSVIADMPKPMAVVAGRPFLDYLLDELAASGLVHTCVLALGHLAGSVIDYYSVNETPLPLRFVVEREPLGTGGAIRNALAATETDAVLALNGDSLFRFQLEEVLAARAQVVTDMVLSLVRVTDTRRYGRVLVDGRRVVGFEEKGLEGGPGLVNAGVYAFATSTLLEFPSGPLSMETEVLPRLVAQARVACAVAPGPFLDIGLPESLAAAPQFVARLREPIAITDLN